jgi:hypothetical protein
MTVTTIAIYVALVGLLLARRVRGQALTTPKKLFVLPAIVAFVGLQDLTHAKMNHADVAVVVIGSGLSLGLGALRGQLDKVSVRDGMPWVRWGAASLVVFAAAVVSRLGLDAVGIAAGGTARALSSSLILSLGLTLLGESAVLWLRYSPSAMARSTGSSLFDR